MKRAERRAIPADAREKPPRRHENPEPPEARRPADFQQSRAPRAQADGGRKTDSAALENARIKGAIRTDFILSAEIIVIALGTVAAATFSRQAAVLVAVATLMTLGVYGLVAGIVKIDDLGLWLLRRTDAPARAIGRFLLVLAPRLMKSLAIVGTAAMFLVGGGIVVHGIPFLHHAVEAAARAAAQGSMGWLWQALTSNALNAIAGVLAGALVFGMAQLVQRLRRA